MAKEYDFDDLNVDNLDFGDFGDDPFESLNSSKNRSPIDEFTRNLKRGTKEKLLDSGILRRLVSMTLPKGYSQVFNAYDGLAKAVEATYKENQADLAPYARRIKMKMDRGNPLIKHLLPRRLQKLMDEKPGSDSSDHGSSGEGPDALNINLAGLDKLFEFQANERVERTIQAATDEVVGKRRFQTEMLARIEIGKGISRLVNYQDNILINYHRRSLEIGYRQLDMLTRSFLQAKEYNAESIRLMDAVRHNTALPDYMKLQTKEIISQQMMQRLADTALGSAGRWSNSFFERVRKNGSDMLGQAFMFKNEIDQASQFGMSRAQAAGSMAGSLASSGAASAVEWLASLASAKAAPFVEKIPGVKKTGNWLQNNLADIPQQINEWIKSPTAPSELPIIGNLVDIGVESVKALFDRHVSEQQITGRGHTGLDSPAIFDQMFHRTVTDVIPSFLASMDKGIRSLVAGSEQEEQTWSWHRDQLIGRKAAGRENVERVITQGLPGGLRMRMDQILDAVGVEGLSQEAVKTLRGRIAYDMAQGNRFKPERYADVSTWSDAPQEIAEEIVEHISDRFGLGIDGKRVDNNEEIDARLASARVLFTDSARELPGYNERMKITANAVGRRTWRELGLSNYDGRGDDVIDLRALYGMLANLDSDQLVDLHGGDSPSGGWKPPTVNPSNPGGGFNPAQGQGPGNEPPKVSADVEWPEQLNTSDEKSHEHLLALLEQGNETQILLQAILENSGSGGGGEGPSGDGDATKRRSVFRRALGGLGWVAGKFSKGMYRYITGSYKLMGKGLLGAAGLGFKGVRGLFSARGIGEQDVYVQGNEKPVMLARDIKRGVYLDVNSGKVIQSLKDITGEVINRMTGNVVIQQEEFDAGLINGEGESIAGFLTKRTGRLAGAFGKGMFNYTTGVYGLMWRATKGVLGMVRDQFTQFDAYFPGEDTPRIRSILMRRGFYRNAKGEPITSLKDIKGAVYDIEGNEVVSDEEISRYKSFYSRNGSILFTVGRGFVNTGSWAAGLAWKGAKAYGRFTLGLYKGMWKGAKGAIGMLGRGLGRLTGLRRAGAVQPGAGDGEMESANFEIALEQLKVQSSIYDLLKEMVEGNRKGKWDVDGDGVRENSWADILRRRAQKAADKAGTTFGAFRGTDPIVDAIKKMTETMEDKFDSLEDAVEEAGEESLLSQAADLSELGGRGRRGRKPRRPRGRFGRLGRLVGGLKSIGGRAIGALGSAGGWALRGAVAAAPLALPAISAVGSGIAAVGSAVLGVISAPVVLGALAVGGAAYLGYRYYKSSKAKEWPLLYLRMTQYGISPTDETRVQQALALEKLVLPAIDATESGLKISAQRLDIDGLYTIFDVNGDEERRVNMLKWISKRFRPVFLAHTGAMQKLRGTKELQSADEGMSETEVEGFLEIVNLSGMKEVYDDLDTSPFSGSLDEDADDVDDAIAFVRSNKAKIQASKKEDPSMPKVPLAGASLGDMERTRNQAIGKRELSVSAGGTGDVDEIRRGLSLINPAAGGYHLTHSSSNSASKKLTSLNIPTAVRYKTYGLKELTMNLVQQLYRMEELCWDKIAYSGMDSATFGAATEDIANQILDILKPPHEPAKVQAQRWIYDRFFPVILEYAISIRRRYNGSVRLGERNLTGPLMKEVLESVVETTVDTMLGKTSVWSVVNSPWPDVVLETNPGSTRLYIDALDTGDKGGPLTVEGLQAKDRSSAENTKHSTYLTNIALGQQREQNANLGSRGNALENYARIYGSGAVAGGLKGQSTTGYGDGSLLMTGGQSMGDAVQHPGGGTDGDINSIPEATGDGWPNVKDTIIAAARMQGFDPKIAASVAAIESSFKPRAGAGTSSAKGLYQFIDSTWKLMMDKYGKKFGIAPGTHQFDARANAILGVRYLIDNYNFLKSRIRGPVTDTSLYAAHFMGPGGAAKLLSADPNAPASQAASDAAIRANAPIFRDKNGRLRSVGGVIAELDRRMKMARGMHDLGAHSDTVSAPEVLGTGASPEMQGFMGGGGETASAPESSFHPEGSPDPAEAAANAAASAAAAGGSGSGAPTATVSGGNAKSVVAEETAEETPAPQAAMSPTTTSTRVTKEREAREQAAATEVANKSIQDQLGYLNSIDQTLKGISEQMDSLIRIQGESASRIEKSVGQASQGSTTLPRHPVDGKRPHAVT